jgi:hypothetical protein
MANIKQVKIVAEVPFNYLEGADYPAEKSVLAIWLMSPALGLRYDYEDIGYRPNDHGGQTSMYRLRIVGQEAIRFETFDYLLDILRLLGGVVVQADCDDIQELLDTGGY